MQTLLRTINWDSNFFGIKIVEPTISISSRNDLTEVLSLAASLNANLVVVQLSGSQTGLGNACCEYGGKYVNSKRTYKLSLVGRPIARDHLDYADNEIVSIRQLRRLALGSSLYSRFRVDNRFPLGGWQKLYYTWLKNSIAGTIADEVIVHRINGCIAGMASVEVSNGLGVIGLLSVDPNFKRMGVGSLLIGKAISYCSLNDCAALIVSTQAENLPACKLYEHHDFHLDAEISYYHFWLEAE
jgi:ribosomal protein S18 acetylase RimI-like enzyme